MSDIFQIYLGFGPFEQFFGLQNCRGPFLFFRIPLEQSLEPSGFNNGSQSFSLSSLSSGLESVVRSVMWVVKISGPVVGGGDGFVVVDGSDGFVVVAMVGAKVVKAVSSDIISANSLAPKKFLQC